MFNLIVTVLAIVIMIAVAIAGLSYLGPAFENAAAKAVVAQIINGGEQVAGAEALYRADNGGAYDVDGATAGSAVLDLVAGGYLSGAPATPSVATGVWTVAPGVAGTNNGNPVLTLSLDSKKAVAACTIINAENTGVYACDDATAPTTFSFNM